jgi:ribonuclease Z
MHESNYIHDSGYFKTLKVFKMTQIEITFLGTTAAIPTKVRNHPAIHLRYQSENEYCYLFDCGEGTQRQILYSGLNFMRIDEIFITHLHADHFAGLFGLLESMGLEGRKRPLRIFAPEAEKFVEALQSVGYSSKSFAIIPRNVVFEGNEIEILVDSEEFAVYAIPVKHGIPAVAYAFVEKDRVKIDKAKTKKLGLPATGPIYREIKEKGSIVFEGKKIKLEDISFVEKGKKIVYSGDTMPCHNIVKLAADADFLIHDSTFFTDIEEIEPGSKHSSLDDVMNIAKQAKAKEIILTHISRRYQDIKELKEKIKGYENVKIAKDFMKIVLK